MPHLPYRCVCRLLTVASHVTKCLVILNPWYEKFKYDRTFNLSCATHLTAYKLLLIRTLDNKSTTYLLSCIPKSYKLTWKIRDLYDWVQGILNTQIPFCILACTLTTLYMTCKYITCVKYGLCGWMLVPVITCHVMWSHVMWC